MKPLPSVQLLLLALSIVIFSCSSSKYAQSGTSEYDDLYFNKSDRYAVVGSNGSVTSVQRSEESPGVGVGYNSKTLNPDYGLPQDAQTESAYAEDEYYVENHDDAYIEQAVEDYLRNNSTTARRYNSPSYYNNFDDVFWSDPLYYQGTIFDPLYRSYYGVYSPFAYRSFYRPYSSFYRPWGPGLSVSIGFGFGSYYSRYYDPFYYGGLGYGYGYGNRYGGYYGSYYGGYNSLAWCPPSYYGGRNNTVVINNIENSNPGNVRYGTRASRGSGYIVNANGIQQRRTADAGVNTRSIRSAADRTVQRASERTISNGRIIQNDGSTTLPARNSNRYDQADRPNTRFRTHSLDSKSDGASLNQRSGANSSLQQRGQSINRDTYRTPNRNLGTRRSTDLNRNYSTSPSPKSGTATYGTRPNRSAASSGVRSRSNYTRSSTPTRSSSPSRMRSSSPSRAGSSNFGRSSAAGKVSSPSKSSYSRSRSSAPSPSRSRSSIPSRSSGGGTRTITR